MKIAKNFSKNAKNSLGVKTFKNTPLHLETIQ